MPLASFLSGLSAALLRRRHKPFARCALACVSLVLVVVSACTNPQSAQQRAAEAAGNWPKTVRIGYQIVPNAELLAKSLNLVERQFPDTRIQWTAFPAGWKINAAMRAGELDIGMVGSLPVSTGIARDLPFQVYIVHDVIGKNAALAVTKASGIKTIDDLSGKRIGVPFGSTSHYSLLSALKNADIDIGKVRILDMSLSEILSAWKRDAIDGSFIWQTTLSKLLADDGTVLITAGDLVDEGGLTADLGTVSTEFAQTYPDFLPAFVKVLEEATDIYRQEPDRAAVAVSQEVGLTKETSLSIMNEMIWLDTQQQTEAAYLGTPEQPGALTQVLKDSAEFMFNQGALPDAPGLETFEKAIYHQGVTDAIASQEEAANS